MRSEETPAKAPAAGERLESWKEIAVYLKRDVRTVQRWEKRESLPVYRHVHEKLGTVYAYKPELEAWWNNRRPRLQQQAKAATARRRRLAAAAVILAAGAGAVWHLKLAGRGSASPVTLRVAEDTELGPQSALSPDARFISFVDWKSGDLAVREVATGQTRRLTNKGSRFDSFEFAHYQVISPDSRQVAYAWLNKDAFYDLRLVGTDGSNPRVLFRDEAVPFADPRDWSPDGKHILARLGRRDGTNQIALISTADGSLRVLETLDWRYPDHLRFSPDGRHIAYDFPSQPHRMDRDVFLLEAGRESDAVQESALVEHPANDILLGWAPNGKSFLFGSDRSGTQDAWILPVSDGRAQGPARMVKPDLGPSWPIRVALNGSFYFVPQASRRDVYVATVDPGTGQLLAPPALASERFLGSRDWPEWSPEGKHLAYVTQQVPGSGELLPLSLTILSLRTGQRRELFPRLNYYRRQRWSPDGRSILVIGRDHTHRAGLYQIDAETGEVKVVLHSGPGLYYPRQAAWSRDGESVFYLHVGKPIMRRELKTGREKPVYADGGDFAVSPDGRWLAAGGIDPGTKTSVLRLVEVAAGKSRELLRVADPGAFTWALAWTPDGRHVLFTRGSGYSRGLWRVAVESGETQDLGVAMDGPNEIRVHPDGRQIAFGAGKPPGKAELWVMENFLPRF